MVKVIFKTTCLFFSFLKKTVEVFKNETYWGLSCPDQSKVVVFTGINPLLGGVEDPELSVPLQHHPSDLF